MGSVRKLSNAEKELLNDKRISILSARTSKTEKSSKPQRLTIRNTDFEAVKNQKLDKTDELDKIRFHNRFKNRRASLPSFGGFKRPAVAGHLPSIPAERSS